MKPWLRWLFLCWWDGRCAWPCVNWKNGKPYAYCPECGYEEKHLGCSRVAADKRAKPRRRNRNP